MSGPADLGPPTDDIRKHVLMAVGQVGVKKRLHLFVRGVGDTQSLHQELAHELLLLVLLLLHCEVVLQRLIHVLGRVARIGEHPRQPLVLRILVVQLAGGRQAPGLVVRRGDQDTRGVVLLEEVQDGGKGLVVRQDFVHLGSWVVPVAGVVDAGALDHDEEALVAVGGGLAEGLQRGASHLLQGRVHVVLVAAVDLEGDVGLGEKAQQRQLGVGAAVQRVKRPAVVQVVEAVLLGNLDQVAVVVAAAAVGRVGQEMAPTAAEQEVDDPAERVLADLLLGDAVLVLAQVDVRGEARRRGIGDPGRHDEPGLVASQMGSL